MPVLIGTFVTLRLAISQAEILLRVLEELLNALPHSARVNHVLSRFNLVRDEVLN